MTINQDDIDAICARLAIAAVAERDGLGEIAALKFRNADQLDQQEAAR